MRTVTAVDIAAILTALRQDYPGFCLIVADSGRRKTWGTTVYMRTGWESLQPAAQYVRLKHEIVHLAQFARLGTWWFMAQYLTPWGRTALEREAFAAEMSAICEVYGPDYLQSKHDYYVSQFTGSAYYFCNPWPGRAAAWVGETIATVLAGQTPT